MAWPPSNVNRWAVIGPNPGPSIRVWVAMLLRVGVGLSLLSTGLAGYFRTQGNGNGNPWGQVSMMGGLDPLFSALPYLSIGLGLALVLGFLTAASSIAAGFYSLLMPLFSIVQIIGAGSSSGMNMGGRWANDPFFAMMSTMSLQMLLTYAVLIWLSPLENHPYSVDAMIFGRNEIEGAEPAQPGPTELMPPEPVETTIRPGE